MEKCLYSSPTALSMTARATALGSSASRCSYQPIASASSVSDAHSRANVRVSAGSSSGGSWYWSNPIHRDLPGASVDPTSFARSLCAPARRSRGSSLPLARQKLAVEDDPHPRPGLRLAPFDSDVERDRAHDAVAEVLVDERLQRQTADLEYLVRPRHARTVGKSERLACAHRSVRASTFSRAGAACR